MRNRKNDIERYLRGELSPEEMHALEKDALNDPFLAEALEGIEHAGAENFLFDLHALNKSVHYRTRSRARKSKTVKMWGWTVGIAASVLLIAVSGFLVISLLKDQKRNNLAMKEEHSVAANEPSGVDSIATTLENGDDAATTSDQPQPAPNLQRPVPADAPRSAPGQQEKETKREEEPVLTAEQQVTETPTESERNGTSASEVAESPAPLRSEDAFEKGDLNKKETKRQAGSEIGTPVPGATQRSLANTKLLNGHVRSARDGSPIPGVNVLIKGTNLGTVTDGKGFFNISLPADQTKIVFYFIGFESTELPVGDTDQVDVALTEDSAQLSEVVVTGSGVESLPTDEAPFRFAEPAGGRSQFKSYLSKSLTYPKQALEKKTEGKVTIRFTVEPDGKLTDFEILKGIGDGCEEEIIRLVKEGPSWKPSTKGGKPLADQVRVRYTFALPKN